MIFQGIRTSIAKKTYIFVIYRGGGGGGGGGGPPDPPPPHTHLDRPMCDDFCDTILGFTVYIYSTAKETHINQLYYDLHLKGMIIIRLFRNILSAIT